MVREKTITVKGAVIDIWVETNDVYKRRFKGDDEAYNASLDKLMSFAEEAIPEKAKERFSKITCDDDVPCDDNCSTRYMESALIEYSLMRVSFTYSVRVSGIVQPPQVMVALLGDVIHNARMSISMVLVDPFQLGINALAA